MLRLLDRLAGWWLDWRSDRNVADNPDLAGFDLEKAEIGKGELHVAAKFPGVAVLADHAAGMLNTENARNYIEFEMIPRADRGLRPVRITVAWANGWSSPAEKAARMEKALVDLVSVQGGEDSGICRPYRVALDVLERYGALD